MGTPYRTKLMNGVLTVAFQRITTHINRGKFRCHKGTSLPLLTHKIAFFWYFARYNWITPCHESESCLDKLGKYRCELFYLWLLIISIHFGLNFCIYVSILIIFATFRYLDNLSIFKSTYILWKCSCNQMTFLNVDIFNCFQFSWIIRR